MAWLQCTEPTSDSERSRLAPPFPVARGLASIDEDRTLPWTPCLPPHREATADRKAMLAQIAAQSAHNAV
jgi:hypothetical protein